MMTEVGCFKSGSVANNIEGVMICGCRQAIAAQQKRRALLKFATSVALSFGLPGLCGVFC